MRNTWRSEVGVVDQRLSAEANGPAEPSRVWASALPHAKSTSVSRTSLRPMSGRGRRQLLTVPTRTSSVFLWHSASVRVQRCSVPKSPITFQTARWVRPRHK
jgi:hypothetical protein